MKRLYRSRTDRKIAGICGGLAEYWDADPTIIRLAALLVTLVTAIIPMAITYLIGCIIIPEVPAGDPPPNGT